VSASEILHGSKQCTQYLLVVDEVEPSEAHAGTIPLFVIAAIDYSSHATHHATITQGKVVFCVTEFKGGVRVFQERAERAYLVKVQVWRVVLVATVQVIVQLDELLQLAFRLYSFYLYCHCGCKDTPFSAIEQEKQRKV
jgi:hypothetical protein